MIIAVNTIVPTYSNRPEIAEFIKECFLRIISQQPGNTFVIISDRQDHPFSHFENVITKKTSPKRNNLIQWQLWLNLKIPIILKKYKADVFFSHAAISFRAVHAKQYLLAGDLLFLLYPSAIKKRDVAFYKKFFLKSMKKADKVFALSEFCRGKILKHTGISIDKIIIVYPGITPGAINVTYEEREKIKGSYAKGHEYFVYNGIIGEHHNLLNLLKAFSAFKKRQKSSMQLILQGNTGLNYEVFKEKLRLFKFKEDVNVITGLRIDEQQKIIGAAYAFIDVPLSDGFATGCLKAMQLAVPVITSTSGAMPEICADAALYADPEDFQAIALQMMQLFKDENLKQKLIDKGIEHTKKFNWDFAAKLIEDTIKKDVS